MGILTCTQIRGSQSLPKNRIAGIVAQTGFCIHIHTYFYICNNFQSKIVLFDQYL